MATGLKIPVGVDSRGRTATLTGEDNDYKTIMVSLSDCECDNAFQQDIGLGANYIFDLSDNSIRARLQARIVAIFAAFEVEFRYRLVAESIAWSSKEGELMVSFRYFNMESDEEREFTRRFLGNE